MRYWLTALLTIFIVVLGGCQIDLEKSTNPAEVSVDDLPDVRAFQDDFTREFLQSTEETKEGYYPFLSGTGAYKMDFPAGGIVGEKGYAIEKERFESFRVGIEKKQVASSIKVKYTSEKKENVNLILDMLNTSLNKKLEFETITAEDRKIYIASFKNESGSYGKVGYIQNKLTTGGVQAIYTSECIEKQKFCEDLIKTDNTKMLNWLKSIKFIQE